MLTKYGLPIVAVGMLIFAVNYVVRAQKPIPALPPPIEPARNPFSNTVAGAGMVEPQTEFISMGSPTPGVVVEVTAKVGAKVQPGDPLFRLDDRMLRAELAARQRKLADARAQLARLESMPRREELPPAAALVREARADYDNMQDQLARGEKLFERTAAITEEELSDRRQRATQALERYNKAMADYDLLEAGAWEPDKVVARSAVQSAEAQVKQVETELDRLTVRAYVESKVLQVNVRPGEFVGAPANSTLVMLGDVQQLHVRVDVDEYDIHRFNPEAPARASLKGQPKTNLPLSFVRVEPYVVPKKSLTGDNTERVDTRVLQVIYAIDAGEQRLFVGQQLDVFIDATDGATKE